MLYTTIVHEARISLGLSMEEWAVADYLLKAQALGLSLVKSEIAESLGLSLSSVKRHVKKLEDGGEMEVFKAVQSGLHNGSKGAETGQNEPGMAQIDPQEPRRKESTKEKKNIYIYKYNNNIAPSFSILALEVYEHYISGFAKDKRKYFEKARALNYLEELLKEFTAKDLMGASTAYKKAIEPKFWMSPQYFFSNSKASNAKKYRPFIDHMGEEQKTEDVDFSSLAF